MREKIKKIIEIIFNISITCILSLIGIFVIHFKPIIDPTKFNLQGGIIFMIIAIILIIAFIIFGLIKKPKKITQIGIINDNNK